MTSSATVLLPVRNGQRWIDDCMRSLTLQTCTDFEVVVIDDGCTDQTVHKIRAWGLPNLRLVNGPQRGLASALALGVELARTPVLIRQDQDDVSLPSRVERQLAFLEKNPACVAVGSAAELIDENGEVIGALQPPYLDHAIRMRMSIECPFIHPSMALRTRSVLAAGNYWSPNAQPFPEDFHLWSRLARQGDFANIRQPLIQYRLSQSGVSRTHPLAIAEHSRDIAVDCMERWLGRPLTPSQRNLAAMFHARQRRISPREAAMVVSLLVQVRARGGIRPVPGGLPLKAFARPIGWTLREPLLTRD